MVVAEPLGHQHFDRPAQELRPPVPEYPLGLGIDHDDFAGPIDHHHRIGRSLDDQAKAPLGSHVLLGLGSAHFRHR